MFEIFFQKKLQSASGEMLLEVDCNIVEGDLITLYGKSGAGKTSTLRILAGLLAPEKGHIIADGHIWLDTNKKINLRPQKRKIGFVFQDYALFPNMTVRENLLFALEKNGDKNIIHELIDIVELKELQDRKPDTLSGGQKQRVALARALVQRPKLLMLDEPLSALDQEMRVKLQVYILKVHREFGLTTILISHDISEVMRMSDKVIVLENGKIIKQGNVTDVFSQKKKGGTITLNGEVFGIKKADIDFLISLLIGSDLIEISLDEEKANELKVGDMISFSFDSSNPNIQKIK